MANIEITVQSFLNSARKLTVIIDENATVSQLKTAIFGQEGVDVNIMRLSFQGTVLNSTDTLDVYNIQQGSFIRSSNVISTLPTKENKQKAKLDLAAADRAADSNARPVYDITQLPTQYDGNNLINNPNAGGLVLGRPWNANP
jgi:hypothetical protein